MGPGTKILLSLIPWNYGLTTGDENVTSPIMRHDGASGTDRYEEINTPTRTDRTVTKLELSKGSDLKAPYPQIVVG